MARPTTSELLEACELKIKEIYQGAQSFSSHGGSRSARMPQLKELFEQRRALKQELAAESGSSPVVATFNFSGVN